MKILPGTQLFIQALAHAAGTKLLLKGTVLTTDGRPNVIAWTSPALVANTVANWFVPVPQGELIWLELAPAALPFRLGDAVARVSQFQGGITGGADVVEVCTGWPSWPSQCYYSIEGRSVPDRTLLRATTIPIANPAAGADWTYTCSNRALHPPFSIRHTFVTSAAVATRFPGIRIQTPAGQWRYWYPVATQAAGVTRYWQWANGGIAEWNSNSYYHVPLPPLELPDASIIQTATSAMDAADQYSNIEIQCISEALLYSEWV